MPGGYITYDDFMYGLYATIIMRVELLLMDNSELWTPGH